MVMTAAERQRKRREKLREEGSYTQYKAKNAFYSKKHREKNKEKLSRLPVSQQEEKQDLAREQAKKRRRKSRQNRKNGCQTPVRSTNFKPAHGYSGKNSLHRAVNRVSTLLPKSPRKRAAVIRKLSSELPPAVTEVKKKSLNSLSQELQTKVTQFYERDDISRIAPGKRDAVTVKDGDGKRKVQKRHLCMSIGEAYSLFKEENPTEKIGKSKFADLRPPAVLLSSQTPANVCTCIYHENMFLALDSIHKLIPSIPQYTSDFPSQCLFSPESESCWFSECGHEAQCGFTHMFPVPQDMPMEGPAKWMQWKEMNGRLAKCQVEGSLQELYNYISVLAPKFLRHVFIKRMQSAKYEDDKKEAAASDSRVAVLQMDFAENFTCIAQDEVQSAHWNQAQITLFTTITWYRSAVLSHVIASDYLRHDKTSVAVFTDHILSSLHDGVKEVRVWTDGPASQFKNKFVMAVMKEMSKQHGVAMSWNFSATSHGKGPVDGVGGTLKRMAAERVKNRKCVINDVHDFKKAVEGSERIKVSVITGETLQEPQIMEKLDAIFNKAEHIKGIAEYHHIQHGHDGLITKRYSTEPANDNTATSGNEEPDEVNEGGMTSGHEDSPEEFYRQPILQDTWYGVYWNAADYWFVGRVLEKQGNEVKMEFIHQFSQDANCFRTTSDIATVRTA